MLLYKLKFKILLIDLRQKSTNSELELFFTGRCGPCTNSFEIHNYNFLLVLAEVSEIGLLKTFEF